MEVSKQAWLNSVIGIKIIKYSWTGYRYVYVLKNVRQFLIFSFFEIQGEEVVSEGVRLVTRMRFIYGILAPPSAKDLPLNQVNKRANERLDHLISLDMLFDYDNVIYEAD